MSEHRRRRRGTPFEVTRIQYGAWDNPGTALFASLPQEPIRDMMCRLKRLPPGSRSHTENMDASPLIRAPSIDPNHLFSEAKHQVQLLADERTKLHYAMLQRQRQTEIIARIIAEEKRQAVLEEKRRVQLHKNSHRLRELREEINRAKTTLSVVQKRNENIQMYEEARAAEVIEAREDRELVRQEKLDQLQALKEKGQKYSDQLVEQIRILKAERAVKEDLAREEGRQKRVYFETDSVNDQKEKDEMKYQKRCELKNMLDDFAELQRNWRQVHAPKPDKLDVIAVEAVNPITKCFIRRKLQKRENEIERRRLISNALGQHLADEREKKNAHENMMLNILVSEQQTKEKKRAHKDKQKLYDQKITVATDLIGQQVEQHVNRLRDVELTGTIEITPTSFMQRQYQLTNENEAARKENTTKTYDQFAADIVHNAEVREALMEEERQIRQALQDMEDDMERRVNEERMAVLNAESPEVINELRPCKLTKVERKIFNLSPCNLKNEDTHTQ